MWADHLTRPLVVFLIVFQELEDSTTANIISIIGVKLSSFITVAASRGFIYLYFPVFTVKLQK